MHPEDMAVIERNKMTLLKVDNVRPSWIGKASLMAKGNAVNVT